MGLCNVFGCALLCVHSGFAINLIGREELVALVSLSSCVSWPRDDMGMVYRLGQKLISV